MPLWLALLPFTVGATVVAIAAIGGLRQDRILRQKQRELADRAANGRARP